MSNKMHIKGVSYPSDVKAKNTDSHVLPVRPGQFIWLVLIGIIWLLVSNYGTPHLRYYYRYSGTTDQPYYHSCQYIGLHSQTIKPHDGKCPLFKLF
jgi:hypothetical protein